MQRIPRLIPGSGRSPGGGHDNALQYSCLGETRGQRSLAGYSPWGHTEWDTTEATEHAKILGIKSWETQEEKLTNS